jgi:hypothetical protein
LTKSDWLKLVNLIVPIVAAFVPGASRLAPYILTGIQEAEQLAVAKGAEKKAHALKVVDAGIATTNVLAKRVVLEPRYGVATAAAIIDTVVGVVNIIHKAQATDIPSVPPIDEPSVPPVHASNP